MNLGIEIGGTKLQIGVSGTVAGTLDEVFRFDIDPAQGAQGILYTIEDKINSLSTKPINIGIGFGGPIDSDAGIVAASHQIEGWSGFDLKAWCSQRFDAKIFVENDANTAALAEAKYGAGKNYDKVFYITLGSGIGGGMVVNQQLYHGDSPGEAEIGLIKINKKSSATLESMCSGWALNKVIRKAVQQTDNSILKFLIGDKGSHESKFLKEAIQQSDELAIKIFDEYCDILAYGLSFVVHLFNPEVIVIGGGVSLIGEDLTEKLAQKLPNYISNTYLPGPEIKLSSLGEQVVLIGALSLIT